MRRVNVMLDAGTIAKAELIGGGNLSAGLREAVKRARKPANVGNNRIDPAQVTQ